MSTQCSSELVQDLEKVFENEADYDVIIKAGPDMKELHVHSFILRARSSYFKKALSSDWEEQDENGYYILKKPNITYEVFQLILKYLYTGIIDYDRYNEEIILQCLVAADELGLDILIEHIQKYLVNNKEILYKDPVTTLEVVHKHETFKSLVDNCLELISEEPKILFSSQKFPLLEKPIITMILQRDDINMEEIDIWDSLLRWLFVHYLKIGKDDSTWSSKDLTNVRDSIKEYVPLIRFYDISKEDFYLKVYPYKDLLPQDLINDIFQYHMAPNFTLALKPPRNSRIKLDSVLINFNLLKLFAKWIDKKNVDYTLRNMPYQFNLLLRGTKDGFESKTFHQLCNNKGASLVVIRIKDSEKMIGGYNPLNWASSGQYSNTKDSFLFKLDSHIPNSAEIGRVINNGSAIYNQNGPTFGSGNDLYSGGNGTWSSNALDYTNINIPNNFTSDEYEVFQVVKKINLD